MDQRQTRRSEWRAWVLAATLALQGSVAIAAGSSADGANVSVAAKGYSAGYHARSWCEPDCPAPLVEFPAPPRKPAPPEPSLLAAVIAALVAFGTGHLVG